MYLQYCACCDKNHVLSLWRRMLSLVMEEVLLANISRSLSGTMVVCLQSCSAEAGRHAQDLLLLLSDSKQFLLYPYQDLEDRGGAHVRAHVCASVSRASLSLARFEP